MVGSQTKWQLSGDYFENCNCTLLCPCVLSKLQATPTEGHCDVPLAFHIDRGQFGQTRLDGLNVVLVMYTPGAMIEGNWSAAVYIDERANEEQREALGAIFGGSAGGPLGAFATLTTTNLGVKFVPIHYSADGMKRQVAIPDVLEMNIEGVAGAKRDEPAYLDNVSHPANTRLATAKGTHTTFKDHGWSWDNTGKNGHYAPINWSGGT